MIVLFNVTQSFNFVSPESTSLFFSSNRHSVKNGKIGDNTHDHNA